MLTLGDELFSDNFPMKLIDDLYFEVEGKVSQSYLFEVVKRVSRFFQSFRPGQMGQTLGGPGGETGRRSPCDGHFQKCLEQNT